jgi:hypothetical protein
MKKLFFSALFLCALGATAQKITPVKIGIDKVADSISVSVMTFKTTDKTCALYYEIFNDKKESIDSGNLQLTEKEFSLWGETMEYIENIALSRLKLTRKTLTLNK